jgi:hypothetical protein
MIGDTQKWQLCCHFYLNINHQITGSPAVWLTGNIKLSLNDIYNNALVSCKRRAS